MAVIREDDGKLQFEQAFQFDRTLVSFAKAFILETVIGPTAAQQLIETFAALRGVLRVDQLVLRDDRDYQDQCRRAAKYFVHRIAVAQGLVELVNDGSLFGDGTLLVEGVHQAFTTAIPGSRGTSGGWNLADFEITHPARVRPGPFSSARQTLGKPIDLAFGALLQSVATANQEVGDAAVDAIECLRRDLYLPAVVMLGKVAEGAWRELLHSAIPQVVPPTNGPALRAFLEDPTNGFSKLLTKARDTLSNAGLQPAIGARRYDLKTAMVWSEVLRQARNTVHFGVDVTVPNDFGKSAVLFVAAADHVRTLYLLRDTLDTLPNPTPSG